MDNTWKYKPTWVWNVYFIDEIVQRRWLYRYCRFCRIDLSDEEDFHLPAPKLYVSFVTHVWWFGGGICDCSFISIACVFLVINMSYTDNHIWPYLMLHSSLWYGDITTGQAIHHTLSVLPCPHAYIHTLWSYWSALTAAAHRLIINISRNHLSLTVKYTHVRTTRQTARSGQWMIFPLFEFSAHFLK